MSRYKDLYKNEIVDAMTKKFGYKNVMQVPKLDKIVINMAVGEAKENAKLLENAANDMAIISGQKPVYTKAKKSIANFKLREGMPIGCKVTLRGDKMYDFLDRLVNFLVFVTLEESTLTHSMEEETMHLVSRSSLSSLKSSMIRLTRQEVWISSLQQLPRLMKRLVSF